MCIRTYGRQLKAKGSTHDQECDVIKAHCISLTMMDVHDIVFYFFGLERCTISQAESGPLYPLQTARAIHQCIDLTWCKCSLQAQHASKKRFSRFGLIYIVCVCVCRSVHVCAKVRQKRVVCVQKHSIISFQSILTTTLMKINLLHFIHKK